MPYTCYDCKIYHGHPLTWCPKCGRKMIKIKYKDGDWEKAKAKGYISEGSINYEYFINGKKLEPISGKRIGQYKQLYDACFDRRPSIFEVYGLTKDSYKDIDPTPKFINWYHGDRYIKMSLVDGKDKFTFETPFITYRVVGSKLPISEESFDYKFEEEFNPDD